LNSAGRLVQISYPPELPVSEKRGEIAQAITENQVVVIAGETGSGKTTQIPKICLELGFGQDRMIGHTQPRRLAARSVAARIAEELGMALGSGVGYQVRFNDVTSPETHIKLMTDGILLAEIQQDRLLSRYDVIIVDEAHERSLNIDFLLGYLKQLTKKRPDLKIIITSATIDVERFAQHFSGAPIVSVSGRTYPVEIVYQDPADGENTQAAELADDWVLNGVLRSLKLFRQHESKLGQGPGDVLVFLSGERDIRELAIELRKQSLADTEIVPLYARLSQSEQQRIFSPHRGRRIILSTNVAETSLTVPGIRYVIDTGLARISRYSVQSKVQRLPIEPVSQASANQRAGRCGRVASGICVRLYSESDFLGRPEFTDPEIQRTNLSAVILQMLALRLGDIESFPFVEPPDQRAINDGFRLLDELDAIDRDRQLTPVGRAMARVPADPRLSRMLIEAANRHCLAELLIIVSALSIQDPRDTPAEKRQAARERHAAFAHPESDFLSWVLLWNAVEQQRQDMSQSQFKKYCKENFLSWLRLREWRETHRQLLLACQQAAFARKAKGKVQDDTEIDYESVHRAMLPGSLSQFGQKGQDGLYVAPRGRKFSIFPSSTLSRKQPRWILTSELMETSRLFATQAARIEPDWLINAAEHLVRREYFEAHWEKKRGEVVAFERVSLFGLVLIEKRRVSFGKIDPALAREIFIREALVTGEINSRAAFLRHNQKLIEKYRKQEEKERRPDIVVPDEDLAAFYANRLPEHVNTLAALERWLRKQDNAGATLQMSAEDVLARQIDETSARAFPDRTVVQQNRLAIDYRFTPGKADDGASITVPRTLLAQMSQQDLDWAVPGLLHERCVGLVKSLPKMIRKHLVPVPEFVNRALERVGTQARPALDSMLAEQAWREKQLQIPVDAWDESSLAAHLRATVKVVDERGKLLGSGQDLEDLKRRFTAQMPAPAQHPLEQAGLTSWTLDEFPVQIEIMQGGVRLQRYPALRDDGNSVSSVLTEDPDRAQQLTERGLARLYMLRTPQQRQMLQDRFAHLKKSLGLKQAMLPADWQEATLLAAYRLAFETGSVRPTSQPAFEKQLTRGKAEVVALGEKLSRLMTGIYEDVFALQQPLKALESRFKRNAADIRAQLEQLFADNFPDSVPGDWLWEYPRYIKALRARIEKLPGNPERDLSDATQIQNLYQQWQSLRERNSSVLPQFPWQLQELRVSMFAQNLGTRQPVSIKRLQKQIDAARLGDIKSSTNLR